MLIANEMVSLMEGRSEKAHVMLRDNPSRRVI